MPLKLQRIPSGFQITNPDGTATNTFQIWWQQNANAIEAAVGAVEAALIAAGIALDAAEAAQDAADVAIAAADDAQTAADSTNAETSIVNSYVSNFTPPSPLSADSLGNITIQTHDRVYGDPTLNPTVSVTGDTIATAAVAGDIVRVYYNDPTRAGGAVTYLHTIDPADPPVQGGDTHSVGAVEIPGAGTVDGGYVRPPGYTGVQP